VKTVENRFVQPQGAARAEGRDVDGDLCSPVVDRNSPVVHGPHETSFFLRPVEVPDFTKARLIGDREEASPFLVNRAQKFHPCG
jgi:hypothetical protein